MKFHPFLYILIAVVLFTACSSKSPLPDKSILDELTSSEIAEAIQYENDNNCSVLSEGSFNEAYAELRQSLNRLSESERLAFAPLTYTELAEAVRYADQLYNDDNFLKGVATTRLSTDEAHDWKWELSVVLKKVGERYPLASQFIAIW